jgi:hypothetical protein
MDDKQTYKMQHLYQVNGKGLALGSVSIVMAWDSDHAKRIHKKATGCDGEHAKRIQTEARFFIENRSQEGFVFYAWNGDY